MDFSKQIRDSIEFHWKSMERAQTSKDRLVYIRSLANEKQMYFMDEQINNAQKTIDFDKSQIEMSENQLWLRERLMDEEDKKIEETSHVTEKQKPMRLNGPKMPDVTRRESASTGVPPPPIYFTQP